MTIVAVQIPEGSALASLKKQGDFLDCYATPKGRTHLTAAQAAQIAFGTTPEWVNTLMRWRNRIVAPFGLKTGPIKYQVNGADIKQGSKLGVFQVYSISDTEVIMGEDDRHLDFRVSVMVQDGAYHIATWVRHHNMWGKMYLRTIMPFHKAIAKNTIARVDAHR